MEVPEPPPIRRGFLTRTVADAVLRAAPAAPCVRGDLQVHTLGSDGTASVATMARAAADRGLDYLAITDHSKGLAIAGGMDESAIARQGSEIDAATAEVAATAPGFRVLRAVEMNLSPAGEGDLDPDFLATLDLVLGAFHSRLRVMADQTERYLAAIRNPTIDVLAHPRGRIFNFRLGLTADWPRVFAEARDRDRAIEIDAFPDRQDIDLDLLALARNAGVRISIGSDSHAAWQFEFLDFGIAAACRAGIPEERIVNCMPVDELLAWTASHRAGGARASDHRRSACASASG
jgi:histidinol phosphatase-like PHP family hydrolase